MGLSHTCNFGFQKCHLFFLSFNLVAVVNENILWACFNCECIAGHLVCGKSCHCYHHLRIIHRCCQKPCCTLTNLRSWKLHFKITSRRCYYSKRIKIAGGPIAALIYTLMFHVGKFLLALYTWNSLNYLYVHVEWEGTGLNNEKDSYILQSKCRIVELHSYWWLSWNKLIRLSILWHP